GWHPGRRAAAGARLARAWRPAATRAGRRRAPWHPARRGRAARALPASAGCPRRTGPGGARGARWGPARWAARRAAGLLLRSVGAASLGAGWRASWVIRWGAGGRVSAGVVAARLRRVGWGRTIEHRLRSDPGRHAGNNG